MKYSNYLGVAYSFQAFIISIWWIGITQSETFYNYFEFNEISKALFQCFLIPDVIAISLVSLILCYKPLKSLQYIVLGAFAYATIFCLSVTFTFGGGEISSIIMAFGLLYNVLLCFQTDSFKSAKPNKPWVNVLKTAIQTFFMWSVFLAVIPYFLLKVEEKSFDFELDVLVIFGVSCFLLFSVFGLYTGYSLSTMGTGTPLPTDATTKLVTKGPYRYVRNPMAIAGVGQGLSIAVFTKSIAVAIFFILGAVIWHMVVRKAEEQDLLDKFGDSYKEYQREVTCWLPRIKAK